MPVADSATSSPDAPEPVHGESSLDQPLTLNGVAASIDDLRALEAQARRVVESARRYLPDLPFLGDNKPPAAEKPAAPRDPQTERPAKAPVADAPQAPVIKATASDLARLFANNFDRLDSDGDGFVSEAEIDRAMASSKFKGVDALLVDVLKRHRRELQSLSNDEWGPETNGVSRADMKEFEALCRSGSKVELVQDVDKTLQRAQQSLDRATCREAFSNPANPLESIKPEAIIQGRIQDSSFLAALASLAKNNPQAVAGMIKDNGVNGSGDRTYTVTFPGDPDHPLTVTAPTDAELGRYASATKYGAWPAILEKAFGAYSGDTTVHQDALEESIRSRKAMRALNTGGVDIDFISFTNDDELDQKMWQAMLDKVPVTARISHEFGSLFGLADDRTDDAGLPCGQEYSVLAYDSKTKTVTLRNPRGYGEPVNKDGTVRDGKNDGVFTMTLDEFQKNFTEVAYGQV